MKLTTALNRMAAQYVARPDIRLTAYRPGWRAAPYSIEFDHTGKLWLWRGDEGQIRQYSPNVPELLARDWVVNEMPK